MMVTACRRGGKCLYLPRRRCLFVHSAEEVAAALLVGSEAPRDDVLELAAEMQELRRVVQRLAGTIVWDRVNPAASAVAKPAVEARLLEVAKDKTLTETVCADPAAATIESEVHGSSGEAKSSWPGAERTPSASITAVAMLAGRARLMGTAK